MCDRLVHRSIDRLGVWEIHISCQLRLLVRISPSRSARLAVPHSGAELLFITGADRAVDTVPGGAAGTVLRSGPTEGPGPTAPAGPDQPQAATGSGRRAGAPTAGIPRPTPGVSSAVPSSERSPARVRR